MCNMRNILIYIMPLRFRGGAVEWRGSISGERQEMSITTFTPKMAKALSHYLRYGNKAAAYRHAYDISNMKAATAYRRSQDLFSHPMMATAVEAHRAETAARLKIDGDWVLRRAALLADFNINKFLSEDDHGNAIYDFSMASDDDWYCISEYTVDELRRGAGDDRYYVDQIKIKTFDKLRALELVGKHTEIQAFRDNVSLTGPGGGPIEVRTLNDFYTDNETDA